MSKYAYGRIRDLGDFRDKKLEMAPIVSLPPSVDLRPLCPPIENQLELGSCTSFSGGAAVRVERKKQDLDDFVVSHLALYYNSRSSRTKRADAGASNRDMLKAIAKLGVCPESEWPYDISKYAEKPPVQAAKDALKNRALSYLSVAQSLSQIKNCLAQGYPMIIGFTVYESFESSEVASTGIVPMPTTREAVLGGHSVLLVGYSDADKMFLLRNSWGSWGLDGTGYFKMPYPYLMDSNLSSDFWTIRLMSS